MPSASPDWIAGVMLQLGVHPVCALSLSAFTCPHRPLGLAPLITPLIQDFVAKITITLFISNLWCRFYFF